MPRILVLESSSAQQKIIVNCLCALGFCDVSVHSKPEDVNAFDLENAQLVILDNYFGKYYKRGLSFMYDIKKAYPHLKFFFYSSDQNVDAALCALRLGAQKYTQKGLKGLQELVTSVARHIEREQHLLLC